MKSLKAIMLVGMLFGQSVAAQQVVADSTGTEILDPLKPQVVRVLPKTESLPANFLKFYLIFPGRMERGVAFEHITLFEETTTKGEPTPVLEPFREVELWDETGTRLTLWLHPGRQKPGVNLNVEFGPVLNEGKKYRLDVSGEWKTEAGKPLGRASHHWFQVESADYEQPEPSQWELLATTEVIKIIPLRNRNPRQIDSLDPVSLQKRVTIISPSGKSILTQCEVFYGEFTLKPKGGGRFPHGAYQLKVEPELEDLAGNSVARPFNLDLAKNPDFVEKTKPVILDFVIK